MDNPAIANAEHWLDILRIVRNVGAVLVVIGVAMELLGDWFARPYEKTVENARVAEVAHAEEAAAKATEKAAQLEKEAAEARLEQERIKETLSWRELSPEATTRLRAALARKRGNVQIAYVSGDSESQLLAMQIAQVFQGAGWQAAFHGNTYANTLVWGIFVEPGAGDASLIASAFQEAGLPFKVDALPPQLSSGGTFLEGAPTVLIGSKPRQFAK